ncbi:MAG: DNA-3-methyladenine glycosylase I [Alphaproteobacteria bacterium]|nr:DNA-3-methyladenine glycosylase I [Alphaproteobacteria bacterium]
MASFAKIRARAEQRKGGAKALKALLSPPPDAKALARLKDDRVLAEMTLWIFRSGFAWKVIEAKWPGFEEAFLGFAPKTLLFQPDEYWEGLARDTRIVRNGMKIRSVRENARFVADVAAEHGSFGKFLAEWPKDDQIGLTALLTKRGSRLGGATGQRFLRHVGYDAYFLNRDVAGALRDAGLAIAEAPTSKRDLAAVQEQFNAWAKETGLSYTELSRICAFSWGENHSPERLAAYMGGESE